MSAAPTVSLHLLPGTVLVTFLVRLGLAVSAVVVAPQEFLTGLRAAQHAMGFGELCRDEVPVDELLPWTGNV
jgi:hypothetical protein